jgi:hypothetical protein
MHQDTTSAPITNAVCTGFRGLHAGIQSIDMPFLELSTWKSLDIITWCHDMLDHQCVPDDPWPNVLYSLGVGRHIQAPAADRMNPQIRGSHAVSAMTWVRSSRQRCQPVTAEESFVLIRGSPQPFAADLLPYEGFTGPKPATTCFIIGLDAGNIGNETYYSYFLCASRSCKEIYKSTLLTAHAIGFVQPRLLEMH